MDKDALINIINSLLKKQPEVRQEIMNYIPAPTILSSMNVLIDLEKKFMNSFPFNKNGPGRDDYTFSRVREYLADLIDTILQYANHFTSSQVFPSTCFSFLDHATHIAHRIPNWDNDENNALKRSLYQDLNDFWKLAIQTTSSNLRQGECYSPESVSEWAKSLAQHNSFTNGYYFTESVHEFTRQLGYMIGLPDTTEENSIMSIASSTTTTHIAPLKTTITTSIVGDRR
ncbi:Cut8 six-helix bundle-domain-containing protein [Mucor mucedo]|nr:Cut8 six-helix bundle-domain-containing protein [Mucor mucedo]KAI7891266.1 Cut8 six-helix bundle-domain-containing protein [Mucor mucedo]